MTVSSVERTAELLYFRGFAVCQLELLQTRRIEFWQTEGDDALSAGAVSECSPAGRAVGLPLYSPGGGRQKCLQDLQTRPALGDQGPLAGAGTARKCGGGGSAEGQLTRLSPSGVPLWFFTRLNICSIGRLRTKLRRSNITDVSFMIVNEQNAVSRALYWTLKKRAPTGVPVYQQEANQTDVWEVLDGDKDDFLIYDRCGLLTFHVVLPYSFLHTPYVEAAIRATYVGDICNCSTVSTQGTVEPPDEGVDPTEMTQPIPHHYHHPSSFFHHQPPPPKMPQDQDQDRSVMFPDPHYQHNLHFHRRHK